MMEVIIIIGMIILKGDVICEIPFCKPCLAALTLSVKNNKNVQMKVIKQWW